MSRSISSLFRNRPFFQSYLNHNFDRNPVSWFIFHRLNHPLCNLSTSLHPNTDTNLHADDVIKHENKDKKNSSSIKEISHRKRNNPRNSFTQQYIINIGTTRETIPCIKVL